MKSVNWQALVGLALLLFGGLFLLQTLNLLPQGGWMWSVPFIAGGGAFLVVLTRGRQNWWAAIPGIVLVFLGALIALSELVPGFSDNIGGAFFLGGIALAFLVVYLMDRSNWWAIIPMGVLSTLVVVTLLDNISGFETGSVFFLGLAFTFALVAILPNGEGRMSWPWIPALVLFALGGLLSIGAESMMAYVFPAALILVGVYMLTGPLFRKKL
jgi:hypothetical protein